MSSTGDMTEAERWERKLETVGKYVTADRREEIEERLDELTGTGRRFR